MTSFVRPKISKSREVGVTAAETGSKARGKGRSVADGRGQQGRRWLVEYPRAVPIAIFLLIASITALSVFAIERGERQREQASLRETARGVASALERRGNTSSAYLRAGAALFATVEDVPAPLFRRFVNELRLDSNYRGAEGIGWAERIRPDQVPEFEAFHDDDAPGDMNVRPETRDSVTQVVPVTFLQPDTERNRRALGFDMYSEPIRRAAMDEAARTLRPTASGRLTLQQEGSGTAAGFIIYMPVVSETGMGREMQGFIYSPFTAQDFLTSALELETRGQKGIRLYDGAVAEENLLAEIEPEMQTGEVVTAEVSIANRPMMLQVESARGSSLAPLSMITLIFGLLVASLLMIVARLLTQQAYEDQKSLDWFAEQNSIRNSLTRELNHRVKNTLANVLSIVSLTRRRAHSLEEFADGLNGRIRALSATHDLLTQSEWGTTPVRDVIGAEIAPYARDGDNAVVMDGPTVELAPNDALSLGLAIHELATNAAKYGALSVADGQVSVQWSLTQDNLARVEWTESGGPKVGQERKRGFGMDLIEKIVAHELRNPVELEFAPQGVRCTLLVPVRAPSEFAIRARRNQG